ncbi:MAG: hypothetical protein RL701_1369 [Pseudomonadota bacterium]
MKRVGLVAGACLGLLACVLEKPVNTPAQPKPAGAAGMAGSAAAGSGGLAGANTAGNAGSAGTAGSSGGDAKSDAERILASGCATSTERSSLLPSNLLFVVDRSGSMDCNPPPTTTSAACLAQEKRADRLVPSKWELTTSALGQALRTLPENTGVGLSYFSNDDQCGVSHLPNIPVAKNAAAQRAAMQASLAGIKPNGSTPLVGATILAYQYLHEAALQGKITGNRYAVLITDGQQSANCYDEAFCNSAESCNEHLVKQAEIALGPGVNIRTFVIGVPGSEPGRTILSRLAKAGGTAKANCVPDQGNCHYDLTLAADLGVGLQGALQSIAGQTLTCELDLPQSTEGPVDISRLNVVFRPNEGPSSVILQDNRNPCDAGADGWQFDKVKQQIRLCGDTCTRVRTDYGGQIDVVLGCPVITPD